MKDCKLYDRKIAVVASVLLFFGTMVTQAAVVNLRDAMRSESSLIHHFSFENMGEASNSKRLDDKAGTAGLLEVIRNTTNTTFAVGMDALSIAGTCVYSNDNSNAGAAWRTTDAIALPSTMTVECLFRPDQVPATATYVLGTRDQISERGYYIYQSSDGKLRTLIGNNANRFRTIVESYSTGHWYYVVSTYAVNAGKTTINSYYTDLTAGGELQHAIVNEEEDGNYGSSAVLGVGALAIDSSQYFAPCTIDEVAFYNTIFSEEQIGAHLAELRRELPIVEYREIFPCDIGVQHSITNDGWKAYYGTNGIYTLNVSTPGVGAETAFGEDLPAVASLPWDTGAIYGYLNNHSGTTSENYLYWSDEMINGLDVGWLKIVTFDTRSTDKRTLRIALRVDTNDTPAVVEDDLWVVGVDFDRVPGTSALVIPKALGSETNDWRRHWFEVGSGEWATLDFIPGSKLVPGAAKVALPTNGLVTAFGLFQDYHEHTRNMRIDNFTIYAQRVYPPPGTIILIR